MEQAEVRKRVAISPIWFLPILAFCIGGWLLYTSYRDAGIEITIHVQTAEGITAGKTKVIYKGIPVGTVTNVTIDKQLNGVLLTVDMQKATKSSLVEDTVFWLVKPVVSAGKITGLETLLSGSYIGVRKGKSSVEKREFIGLPSPPPLTNDTPGLHLTLQADTLYSLQRGSNIYSRNLKIGWVDDYILEQDGKIAINIFIEPKFSHLIREGTRFWNASGLSVTGDLQNGLSVNVESLASLVYGGLTCATPASLKDSPAAEDGQTFQLYKDFDDAQYGIPMTLQLASGEGIVPGKTKIMFRGLKVGVVRTININDDQFHSVTASILLDPRAEGILRENSRFWVIRPQVSLEGIKHLNSLISGTYITFQVGDGNRQDHFIVDSSPMPKPYLRPGTRFTLLSPDPGSLKIGAPLLYKKREIGEITDIRFNSDGKEVRTEILIYTPYVGLVRRDAVFWDVSGVQAGGSLSNFHVNLASLRTMLAGGIAFRNPVTERTDPPQPQAEPGTEFPLYSSLAAAVKQVVDMREAGTIIKLTVNAMAPVSDGAPVLYNKIPVGEVLSFELQGKKHQVEGSLLIYERFTDLVNQTTRFYNASGVSVDASLQEFSLQVESLDSILAGGISFFTPGRGKPVTDGHIFPLYASRAKAIQAGFLQLTLQFKSGKNISNKTKLKYQGIEIGSLQRVWFDPDKNRVFARAAVEKNMARLFRKKTALWLETPQFDLSGIRNLDTVISGAYINVLPGTGKQTTSFTVRDKPPNVMGSREEGLHLVLEAARIGSLKKGRPIYYRQIPIGYVTGVELGPTAQNVWIHVVVYPQFRAIIHRGSRFWNAGGVKVIAGLFSGVSVQTESIETIMAGGVAMATPEGDAMGSPARDGDHFILAEQPEEEWQSWAPKIRLNRPVDNGNETELRADKKKVRVKAKKK
jgi:paraquat-inducible protein B